MKNLFKMTLLSLVLFPAITYAKDAIEISTELLGGFGRVVNIALPLVVSLAVLIFFWGVVRYIWSQGSEGKIEAKKVMLYSLVALFVMVSLYGIIALAQRTFEVEERGDFTVPKVNSGGTNTNTGGGGGNSNSSATFQ